MKKILLILFTITLFAACRTSKEHYIAMRPEVVTTARTNPPFAGAVWIDPEYRWSGTTYVIEPAHWAKPLKSGVWVPGHWRQTAKGYTWVSGYWK
jgi:hypothetical protein